MNAIFDYGEDYNTWYIDERGDVAQDAILHDGTNHIIYREFKPETTDGQRDALLDKIYNGTATRRDITRYTKTLGDRVANVYGWDVSALRRLNRNKKTAA